ncbi:MAG: RraA family protein [Actinomycetia bacterium]|nr:RraA family protein [Actinomycetes bacterium]
MTREEELARVRPRLLGLVAEERIARVDISRPDPEVVAGFLALTDLTSTALDALDELGVGGGIGASELAPRSAGRICGPAITIRYAGEGGSVGAIKDRGERARLAERDLYGIGEAGDVGVFDCGGRIDASVLGSLSARWASRLGIAGCVVDGAVRDLDSVLEVGLRVWSRGVTPVSGKHRLQAVELNGTVSLAGLTVEPGDLVLADQTGVCIVPAAHAVAVLERCRALEEAERHVQAAMDDNLEPAEIAAGLRPDRW